METIRLLNSATVHYLVIGGHAVRFHGCNRPANDLDILCSPLGDNPERLFPVLKKLIGGTPRFEVEDLRHENKQLQFKNNGRNLDILTSLDNVNNSLAMRDKVVFKWDGTVIPFISRKHLLANLYAATQHPDRKEKALKDLLCLEVDTTQQKNKK